jgi:hypothetical protein
LGKHALEMALHLRFALETRGLGRYLARPHDAYLDGLIVSLFYASWEWNR